jgi:TM2 domain-containing membrane protein YozV
MDTQKVEMYIAANEKFFNRQELNLIRERLLAIDDSKYSMISTLKFADPSTTLILSILTGGFGGDRFYLGDTGLGIAKLLTCGGAGIWALIDAINSQTNARDRNMAKIRPYL